ncbi:MAG: hypothetical protein ACJ8C4_18720 [Gemmataceae bacterium]
MRSLKIAAILVVTLLVCVPHGSTEPPREAQPLIKRGVAALRSRQKPDGSWGIYGPGSTALAALALLESDVSPNDDAIVAAAKYLRPEAVRCSHTYSVTTSLLFFDRLHDSGDEAIVKLLAERLLAGQKKDGCWTYGIPIGDLRSLDTKYPLPEKPSDGTRMDHVAPQELRTDNSNTQFAVLGLWTGRRYGLEIEDALNKVDEHFRSTPTRVSSNMAGWDYTSTGNGANGANTCAALMGMAIRLGYKVERNLKTAPGTPSMEPEAARLEWSHDPLICDGMRYMLQEYSAEVARTSRPDLYFMWSVERVATAYGLESIYGVNWYRIGLLRLRDTQAPNGIWAGSYQPEVDTSFALLFLNRSNLTRDLNNILNPKQTKELTSGGKNPEPLSEPLVERLVREFLADTPEGKAKRLTEYRDGQGVEYTEAIARIIPKIDGSLQKTARDGLATRLARMTAETLRARLKDSDVELRRAACVACAMKADKEMIGDLIGALDDREAIIVRAAGVGLARLTGENFGPAANATPAERAKAIAAWKEWWKNKKS